MFAFSTSSSSSGFILKLLILRSDFVAAVEMAVHLNNSFVDILNTFARTSFPVR